MNTDSKAPFIRHLAELRKAVLRPVLLIIVFFIPCYFVRFDILRLAVEPVVSALPEGGGLIFTKPGEGFAALVMSSLFAAFMLALPFTLYSLWGFIAPGLKRGERRSVAIFVFAGTVLFCAGVFFCYRLAAPRALEFLLSEHSSDFMTAMPSVGQSLSFLLTLCFSFGVVFEFPLVAFLLSRWGVVSAKGFAGGRKYAYVAGAMAAAVITPTTDIVSMMFLLVPLAVFYEAGIVTAKVFGK